MSKCSCKVVIEREKFKAVSNLVWVCWKAMIEEKTIKEEWTNKNYSNDNCSYICSQRRLLRTCFCFVISCRYFKEVNCIWCVHSSMHFVATNSDCMANWCTFSNCFNCTVNVPAYLSLSNGECNVLLGAVKIFLNVKRKSRIIKQIIECVKDDKYIYWVKKDLFECFRIEEIVKKTMKQV